MEGSCIIQTTGNIFGTIKFESSINTHSIQYCQVSDIEEIQWNRHDWSTVDYNGNIILCQFLCFLDITSAKQNLSTTLDDINEAGLYAIFHFVDQNVLVANQQSLYMEQYITKNMLFMWIKTVY